jgi:hypothetical protein
MRTRNRKLDTSARPSETKLDSICTRSAPCSLFLADSMLAIQHQLKATCCDAGNREFLIINQAAATAVHTRLRGALFATIFGLCSQYTTACRRIFVCDVAVCPPCVIYLPRPVCVLFVTPSSSLAQPECLCFPPLLSISKMSVLLIICAIFIPPLAGNRASLSQRVFCRRHS